MIRDDNSLRHRASTSTYCFVFTRATGAQNSKTIEFANDSVAIWSGKALLSLEARVLAIGRRQVDDDAIEWLGCWKLKPDGVSEWASEG